MTPTRGYSLTLSAVSFFGKRASSGPPFWGLGCSVGGFATPLGTGDIGTGFTQSATILPLDGAFVDVTKATEIRLAAWSASSQYGYWLVDDVIIYGMVTPIPASGTCIFIR